jgi:hypothetical protein
MTCTPELKLGLGQTGKVVIAIGCSCCGSIPIKVEMQLRDAHTLVTSLNALIAMGERVQSLPLPWVHEAGSA